jgi:protein TilB
MVRVTEELLRSKAEHNESCLATLEEVALHQVDLERFERFDKFCRDIQILLLQNNLIGKIEKKCARRLRALKYLNVAVNNISLIEGLENCEFLEKVDFTVNFLDVEGLLSIETLAHLEHLKELYFTGNPCTQYDGYRLFVVHTLPRLERLDGTNITKSERIQAAQEHASIRRRLIQAAAARKMSGEWKPPAPTCLEDYEVSSDEEDEEPEPTGDAPLIEEIVTDGAEKIDKKANKTKPWCPQTRIEDAITTARQKEKAEEVKKKSSILNDCEEKEEADSEIRVPRPPEGATPEDVRQRNEGKWEFEFGEDDAGKEITLNLLLPKYLDTTLIDLDVQPWYVRVTIKGKVLQMVLPDEVDCTNTKAERSQMTGALLLTLPRARPDLIKARAFERAREKARELPKMAGPELLDGAKAERQMRYDTIIKDNERMAAAAKIAEQRQRLPGRCKPKPNPADFVDNPEVPPLE